MEQFLADHPEHADMDENELMIARIDHEHAERLALEEQRQGLLKKKQGLIADNKKRKDDLANLDKDLEKFIDVSNGELEFVCVCVILMGRYRLPNRSRRLLRRLFEGLIGDNITSRCRLEDLRHPVASGIANTNWAGRQAWEWGLERQC